MSRKTLAVIVLQFIVIVVLFWLLILVGRDKFEGNNRESPQPSATSRTTTEDGVTVVRLSRKSQQLSGIQTVELEQTAYRPIVAAYGSIVSIDALLDLRTRYLAAQAQVIVARTALESSKRDAERQRQLNRDERNVSDRVAEAAEALARGDAARLTAAETLATGLRDSIRQQWPEPLASWATEPHAPPALQKLLDRQEVLVNVGLPEAAAALGRHAQLEIKPQGQSGKPLSAEYVGPAPQGDQVLRGRSYFFRAPGAGLLPGMRVSVRQQSLENKRTGVIVPAAAVIWFAGKAWVYEQEDDNPEEFVRRQIPTDNETDTGWFVADVFEAGDRVVTSGAQLLLSEEFKYQITNENDD